MDPIEIVPLISEQQFHRALLDSLRRNSMTFLMSTVNVHINFNVHLHPEAMTLLEIACFEGRTEAVKHLLQRSSTVCANPFDNVHDFAPPIHFAAQAGHADVLEILLQDERCKPDLKIENQTALHIAVENNYADCVRVLLEYEADPNIVNFEGLTPTDIAARKPVCEIVELILKISKFLPNINDFRDYDGSQVTTRQILETRFPDLKLPTAEEYGIGIEKLDVFGYRGTELNFLEDIRKIPNHKLTEPNLKKLLKFSTYRNFPLAIRELLKKGQRKRCLSIIPMIAEYSVSNDQDTVLKELLTFDRKLGSKLLLLASQYSNPDDGSIECFKLIQRQPNINVRCTDDNGNTPLHYAVRVKFIEAVVWLLKLGSFLGQENVHGVSPLAYMSHKALSEIFDNCIDAQREEKQQYELMFNYRYLVDSIPPSQQPDKEPYEEPHEEPHEEFRPSDENIGFCSEMVVLAYIAKNPILCQLLKHPLLSSFLFLKWHRMRYFIWAYSALYIIFCILINVHIQSNNRKIDLPSSSPPDSSNLTLTILTAIFLFLLAVWETFQIISSPRHYLSSIDKILQLGLIGLGVWTLAAPNPQTGAGVILLSSWGLFIIMGQYSVMYTSIEMLKIVTRNFLKILLPYAILILAFALAFYTLFCNTNDNQDFQDFYHSLFKTIIMFTGEFEAKELPFPLDSMVSRCIFVLFVFLITIVMLNLLNGLAGSDTATKWNQSEIVALKSRVKLLCYFEAVAAVLGRIKIAGRRLSDKADYNSMFNLFPKYLPTGEIIVTAFESNKIKIRRHRQPLLAVIPTDVSLDPAIIDLAREVILRRESQTNASKSEQRKTEEHRENIAELHTIKGELNAMREHIAELYTIKSELNAMRQNITELHTIKEST